jgi:site-specific recombinase XerD
VRPEPKPAPEALDNGPGRVLARSAPPAGLRLEDLRFAERRVFIAEGKGGRQRLSPVSGRFFAAVAAYLDAERPAGWPRRPA